MAIKTIKDIDLKGKKVLVRVDFNVPLDENSNITDDARIKAALPTLEYILNSGAEKIIVMSHLGRPKGKIVGHLSLKPVALRLQELLQQPVVMANDCIGQEVEQLVNSCREKIILLENLRFYSQETAGDEEFAKQLAKLGDIYVNDAFGTAHRAHASTAIVAKFLPAAIGFLMEKEIRFLSEALNPKRPYVVILGGAKVSDKIGVVENLINKADTILIAGAMAYTFLKSKGEPIGASRVEEDKIDLAKHILEKAAQKNVEVVLPVDHCVVKEVDQPEGKKIVEIIEDNFKGVDVGPKTVNLFKEKLANAKTVLWNGPLGIFEKEDYSYGTKEIALFLAELKEATVIVGGGDSASAAKKFNIVDKVSHVSTGGGASLEFLEGKELPGIKAIDK